MSIQSTAFKQALKYLMGAEKKFIDKRQMGLAKKLVNPISVPMKTDAMLLAEGRAIPNRARTVGTDNTQPVEVFGPKPYNELGQEAVRYTPRPRTDEDYARALFGYQNDFGNNLTNILNTLRPYTRSAIYGIPTAGVAGAGIGYNRYQDEEERKRQEALQQMLGG